MNKPAQIPIVEQFPDVDLPESQRELRQQSMPCSGPMTINAIGLLRRVIVEYGQDSWPDIDALLDVLVVRGMQAGVRA